MSTITVPKELSRINDLIAVPRKTYGEFLVWQKKIKSARTFKPTLAEKKVLQRARKNFAKGEYLTLNELKHDLGIDN